MHDNLATGLNALRVRDEEEREMSKSEPILTAHNVADLLATDFMISPEVALSTIRQLAAALEHKMRCIGMVFHNGRRMHCPECDIARDLLARYKGEA